jgi:hypothetical protein
VQRNRRPGTGLSSPTQGSGTGPDRPKDECANPWPAGWETSVIRNVFRAETISRGKWLGHASPCQ